MALSPEPLRIALAALKGELAAIDTRTSQIRETAAQIERLLATLEREAAPGDVMDLPALAANGEAANQRRRPLLRDSIPAALRGPSDGLTLKALTEFLWQQDLVGGEKEETRIEIVRPALKALEREGVVASETPPGEKAAVWRMSNVQLPRPPAYTPEEQESGI